MGGSNLSGKDRHHGGFAAHPDAYDDAAGEQLAPVMLLDIGTANSRSENQAGGYTNGRPSSEEVFAEWI